MDPVLPAATVIAFLVALVATPAGVSGAVFLLPVQLGVLGVATPAVTPTNLVYNLIATPPAVIRRWRDGALEWRLAGLLVVFAVPGVLVGAVLRVTVLPGRTAVLVMIGVLLSVLGVWLLAGGRRPSRRGPAGRRMCAGVAGVAGVVGGAYGIGGGAVIAPVLTAAGIPAHRIAPAAIATTLVTSVVGVVAFEVLAAAGTSGPVAPRWDVGIALGIGGAFGAYLGARRQGRIPEARLRRLIGAVALPVGLLHLGLAAAGA